MQYEAARSANQDDFEAMLSLPERPGKNSVGRRSLVFCHPNHSRAALDRYFQVFPDGIFISEQAGQMISFACSIRTSQESIEAARNWSQTINENAGLAHQQDGQWMCVGRLAYTASPGHAHLSSELGPILVALKKLSVTLELEGVAFPSHFPGLGERSGTTTFQRSCIADPNNQVRSGLNPIGTAYHDGFRHGVALPNYLGDGRHFALMVWRRNSDR